MRAVAYIHSRFLKNFSILKYFEIHLWLILTIKSGHFPASIVAIQKGVFIFTYVT